jgi:hypothetical protein
VWGYDTNGNGTPDVIESRYVLIYDVNGGNNDGPAQELLSIQTNHVLSSVKPTHANDGEKEIVFLGWAADPDTKIYAEPDGQPVTITTVDITNEDVTVYAVWGYKTDSNETKPPVVTKNYYITATADSNSNISPVGMVKVLGGDDASFAFSASHGYYVAAVLVDGIPLSRDQISLGYYTFRDVVMNHSIDVKADGLMSNLTLRIDVAEGKGYAEYSIDGKAFVRYTGIVNIFESDDIVAKAYAADGYTFVKWETPAAVTTSQVSFDDVKGSLHLYLYFTGESNGSTGGSSSGDKNLFLWILAFIILLILIGLLLWFLLFYRRYYDVIKVESTAEIIGDDMVHRKSRYVFTIAGTSANVSYRVGDDDDTPWKTLLPDADGKYIIPKGEITDDVTIEQR